MKKPDKQPDYSEYQKALQQAMQSQLSQTQWYTQQNANNKALQQAMQSMLSQTQWYTQQNANNSGGTYLNVNPGTSWQYTTTTVPNYTTTSSIGPYSFGYGAPEVIEEPKKKKKKIEEEPELAEAIDTFLEVRKAQKEGK